MAKKHYDEVSVVRSLSRKSSIQIISSRKEIEIKKGATDVGNGSWGKIDYLCHVHGYHVFFTKSVAKSSTIDDGDGQNYREAKKSRKLNMAAMAKNAMKRVKTK